jgi:hypothetical protein
MGWHRKLLNFERFRSCVVSHLLPWVRFRYCIVVRQLWGYSWGSVQTETLAQAAETRKARLAEAATHNERRKLLTRPKGKWAGHADLIAVPPPPVPVLVTEYAKLYPLRYQRVPVTLACSGVDRGC